MPRVLIVDDQPDVIDYFVDALKARHFDVDVIPDVVAAIDYLNSPPGDLVAIILDIIMPPGPFADKEHQGGLRTGKFLHEHILNMEYVQEDYGHRFPIAVLTQVSDQGVLKEMEEIQIAMWRKAGKNPKPTWFQVWSKYEVEPKYFAIEFEEWLKVMEELSK